MPGIRRSHLAIESARRTLEQRVRIGSEIRAMRERRGWTRTDLAARAGIGRMVQGRVERGVTPLDLDVLQRIGLALGRPVLVTFGRDLMELPADAAHLAMQELVLRVGRAAGYSATVEVPSRPSDSWRSIDVVLTDAVGRCQIIVECWNTIGDVGTAARSTTRKVADLEAAASGRDGPTAMVGVVWVVRATARNRALLQRYPEVFAAAFPGSSRGWVEALLTGCAPPAGRGLIWSDVGATRIFGWRRLP